MKSEANDQAEWAKSPRFSGVYLFFRTAKRAAAISVIPPASGEINSNGRLATAINAIPRDNASSFM